MGLSKAMIMSAALVAHGMVSLLCCMADKRKPSPTGRWRCLRGCLTVSWLPERSRRCRACRLLKEGGRGPLRPSPCMSRLLRWGNRRRVPAGSWVPGCAARPVKLSARMSPDCGSQSSRVGSWGAGRHWGLDAVVHLRSSVPTLVMLLMRMRRTARLEEEHVEQGGEGVAGAGWAV